MCPILFSINTRVMLANETNRHLYTISGEVYVTTIGVRPFSTTVQYNGRLENNINNSIQ